MKARLLMILAATAVLLIGCERRANFYDACDTPDRLSMDDLSGTWVADYADYYTRDPLMGTLVMSGTRPYLIDPSGMPLSLAQRCETMSLDEIWSACLLVQDRGYAMDGFERLLLTSGGAYTQTFAAVDYQTSGKWELMLDHPDAPVLRMSGMRYFAAGWEFAKGDRPIYLEPQLPDLLEGETGNTESIVHYPEDGLVYLYPRRCAGELVLQQMVFGGQEPDSPSLQGPVFKRQAGLSK
jgi:hypothetical protein